jgi:serine protease AprX
MPQETALKKATWGVALASILVGAAVAPVQAAPKAPKVPKAPVAAPAGYLNPDLARLAVRDPGRDVDVIAQLHPGVSAGKLQAGLESVGVEVTRQLPIINALVVRLDARLVGALAAAPGIRAVTPDGGVQTSGIQVDTKKLVPKYAPAARASGQWGTWTGKGIGVAVVDSGISDHKDFADRAGGTRVAASVVANPGATSAKDTVGHGTHVAGIIGGDGAQRRDALASRYVGIAPEVDLLSIKVDDAEGGATVSDVIAGVQFAVTHRQQYNIRVLNLSLNSDVAQPYDVDPLNAAAEVAWFKGIVVVAAAGNRGTAADAVNYAPANDPYVITVGATDDKATDGTKDDVLAAFSSRGRTQDGFAKPEVTASGSRIVSTLAAGSDFARECPSCVVDGEYLRIGGTSMATAVVSGVVANLLQAKPTWTPNQVKGALVNTAAGTVRQVDQPTAMAATGTKLVSNQGLTPNDAIDPATGDIKAGVDSTRSSWSTATGGLSADWTRSSWSCGECTGTGITTDFTRSSWSRSSWSAAVGR